MSSMYRCAFHQLHHSDPECPQCIADGGAAKQRVVAGIESTHDDDVMRYEPLVKP